MSQVLELLTLQEIDDEMASFRAALESVQQRLKGDAELDDARRRLQYVEGELQKVRGRQRRLESEIDDLNEKIVPEERRLYDGSIRNPKELESLEKELAFLQGNRSHLEDRLLRQMTQVEELEPQQRDAARRIEELEQRWEARQVELRQESRRIEENIETRERRRDDQRKRVPPRTLHLYEDLRAKKGGVAVAPIRAGACSACRVALPGAVKSKTTQSDALVQCPNCERILTVG